MGIFNQGLDFIGEIGINHDGSFTKAIELMIEAKEIGINIIKFQMFTTEKHADIKQYMFCSKEWELLFKLAKQLGMKVGASVFAEQDVENLKDLKPDFIKIPRGVTSKKVIDKVLTSFIHKHILISRDFTTKDFIEYNAYVHFLFCEGKYSEGLQGVNFNVLKGALTHKPTKSRTFCGYSSHSGTTIDLLQAYMWGATVIEAHIKNNNTSSNNPDFNSSIHINELKPFIKFIKKHENNKE